MLDLLIRQATVYDGTGSDPFVGDVGIQGDKIVTVGKIEQSAHQIIEAEGLSLCPGFVDIHSHSDYFLLIQPSADSKVTQGVTTEIGGNCGYAAAPIWGDAKSKREEEYKRYYGLELGWSSLAQYLKRLEKEGIGINYGQLIGHNTIRQSAMGVQRRAATHKELSEMKEHLKQGMKDGAFGISTGLIYPPACYSNTDEVTQLAKVCQSQGGIFTFHMRSESDGLVDAVKEALDVGKEAQIPVQISHIKTSGERNWHKIDKVLGLIEKFKSEGGDVECDRYPYVASQTGLMQVLPDWTFEGGPKGLVKTLKDPENRDKIKKETLNVHPPKQDYFNKVVIMEVMSKKNKKFEGLSIKKGADLAKKDPFEFLFDILIEEEAAISAIYFTMSEDNLKKFISKDYIFIASDSGCRAIDGPLAKGRPHPRIYGTFPRVIRKYVKEESALVLSQAIFKMTWQPAKRFKIDKRGKIAEGFFADLLLFDFEKITDKSEFLDPFHYTEGIASVWVNGVCAVDHGKITHAKAGKVLRKGI